MYITRLATTVLATACLGAAAPLDKVRDPAAAAAFAEVFARLDAVEAELRVERQGRATAETRASNLTKRVAGLEEKLRGQGREVAQVRLECGVPATNINKATEKFTIDGTGEASRRLQTLSTNSTKLVKIHVRSACSRHDRRRHHHCLQPEPENNGHRRFLQQPLSQKCTVKTLTSRTNTINEKCCDEPTEDCSSGVPAVCNAGCAAIFLPYYAECSGLLHLDPHTSSILQTTAAKCRLAESEGNGGNLDAGSSLARQLDLVCDGVALKDCIPDCDARLHGDLVCLSIQCRTFTQCRYRMSYRECCVVLRRLVPCWL